METANGFLDLKSLDALKAYSPDQQVGGILCMKQRQLPIQLNHGLLSLRQQMTERSGYGVVVRSPMFTEEVGELDIEVLRPNRLRGLP